MQKDTIYFVAGPLRRTRRMLHTSRAPHIPPLVSGAFLHALGVSFWAIPAVASAAAPRTFLDLSNLIVLILDNATAVLIVAGIVIYFYGISTNILSFSEDGGEKVKAYFFWGIIVLFVMVSIWGILRLLQSTLFGSSANNPTTGQAQSPQGSFQAPRFIQE